MEDISRGRRRVDRVLQTAPEPASNPSSCCGSPAGGPTGAEFHVKQKPRALARSQRRTAASRRRFACRRIELIPPVCLRAPVRPCPPKPKDSPGRGGSTFDFSAPFDTGRSFRGRSSLPSTPLAAEAPISSRFRMSAELLEARARGHLEGPNSAGAFQDSPPKTPCQSQPNGAPLHRGLEAPKRRGAATRSAARRFT